MTIKRFGDGSDLDDEALILFENFGITVYLAQLYEGFLSNILTGLERLQSCRESGAGIKGITR